MSSTITPCRIDDAEALAALVNGAYRGIDGVGGWTSEIAVVAGLRITPAVLAQLNQVESNIHKDLASGLITQGDAATQLAAVNQAKDAYTDSKIAEVLLTYNVLDKTTNGTKSLIWLTTTITTH